MSCKVFCAANRVTPTPELEARFRLDATERSVLQTMAPAAEPVIMAYVTLSPVVAAVGYSLALGLMVVSRGNEIRAQRPDPKAKPTKPAGPQPPGPSTNGKHASEEPELRPTRPVGTLDGLTPYSDEWFAAIQGAAGSQDPDHLDNIRAA